MNLHQDVIYDVTHSLMGFLKKAMLCVFTRHHGDDRCNKCRKYVVYGHLLIHIIQCAKVVPLIHRCVKQTIIRIFLISNIHLILISLFKTPKHQQTS